MKPRNLTRILMVAILSLATHSLAIAQSGSRSSSAAGQEAYAKYLYAQSQRAQADSAKRSQAEKPAAVVVELFTSQGCSSCPPADSALRQIAATAEESALPVYVLSFHVDYWNQLGWTDPYSQAAFSERQRAYASAWRSKRVYTPQMIVGGQTEFVGSNKAKAHEAITKALTQAVKNRLELQTNIADADGVLTAQYKIMGPLGRSVLNLALVDSPTANNVPRGENAGRELTHVNVVRALHTLEVTEAEGTIELAIPQGMQASKWMLIAYLQDRKSLAILAATTATP